MRYGHAIAMTMASALVADPAFAQNGPTTPQYGQGPQYGQASYGPTTRGWVVSEPDIHNFSGPRAEARLDWSDLTGPTAVGNGGYGGYCGGYYCGYNQELSSNFNAGGEIGYDVPITGHFTVGPYGRYTTNITSSSGCLSCTGDDYAVGARAGFMVSSRFLVYGKIGYNNLKSLINYSYTDNAGISHAAATNFHYSGAEFGIGVNYRMSQKYYIGLEFMDNDYGNGDPYYGGDQRFDLGLSVGMHL